MLQKIICFCLVGASLLGYAIPPELLQQNQNLTIPNSFIAYDTATKFNLNIVAAGIKVMLPKAPKQNTVEVYSQNEKVIQQQYICTLEEFGLTFQVAQRPVNSSQIKNLKTLFWEEKDRFILQFGNYPVIQSVTAKEAGYEIIAPNNLIYRIKQIVSNSTITTFLVYGKAPAIYTAPANDFFASIEGNNESIINDATLLKPKSNKKSISTNNETQEISLTNGKYELSDSLYRITFLNTPKRNDFVIKSEDIIYTVSSYFTSSEGKENQYLFSYRKYDKPIQAEDVLMEKAAEILASSSNTIIVEGRNLEFYKYPSKEFTLENKKTKYVVRYFVSNNTFYQLVVKNAKKNIDAKGIQQYFESFILP